MMTVDLTEALSGVYYFTLVLMGAAVTGIVLDVLRGVQKKNLTGQVVKLPSTRLQHA